MPTSYTGRQRRKKTHWSVRFSDRFSRVLISVGGIGTLLAVSTVFVFLFGVVLPLFRPARTGGPEAAPAAVPGPDRPLWMQSDETGEIHAALYPDGRLICVRSAGGAVLEDRRLFPDARLTAFARDAETGDAVFGFEDGALRTGRIGFEAAYRSAGDLPPALQAPGGAGTGEWEDAVFRRISPDQFLTIRVSVALDPPIAGEPGPAIRRLDQSVRPGARITIALDDKGALTLHRLTRRENLLTGQTTIRRASFPIPYPNQGLNGPPEWLFLSGLGDTVCAVWRDGTLLRLDTRDPENPSVIEQVDLAPEPGRRLTEAALLLGRTTLLTGDSEGRIEAWFPAFFPDQPAQSRMVLAHRFQGPSAVRVLASSARIRMIAAGYEDGTVELYHVTSRKRLARLSAGAPVRALSLAPRDDELTALTADERIRWPIDPGHPEATFASLLAPVWYESAPAPAHVWQSSSGTDDFEPKFGLRPLIFGTLKATLFSMLFGAPVALLAAIFTSEFLPSRAKLRIKPAVEMMAGLPSVVLGFLAALVLAPVVASRLTPVLLSFFAVPVVLLCGAHLWQLLPRGWTLRLERYRLLFHLAAIPAGAAAAVAMSPWVERVCFAGDVMRWLDGQIGTAFGGWFLILLPATGLAAALGLARWAEPILRARLRGVSRPRCAAASFGLFLGGLALTAGFACLGAGFLQALGADPRGALVDTYVQRNALVVGIVMGFAVIPIIYTLSEDALTSIPESLRSASLGAGATPWQTAVRIVIPTAMSGLFSAAMIGLGRAAGETMIVLMAAGNTPVMEWNLFNGFRTLSANIAVELPEAVRNSTHYRTLFLAALVLFVLTFVLNTAAELVRMRYRKKAVEL